MAAQDDQLIRVHAEWNGWRNAEVRLRDLEHIHWSQPGPAPHPIVHGYVSCTKVVGGGIPHDCDQTAGPHRLLVCVLKKHALPTTFAELARRADLAVSVPPQAQLSSSRAAAAHR